MCSQYTSAPDLQILFHEFFRRGKLTELDLGHVVALTDCADHLWFLLMAVLSLNVDPRDFPNDKQRAGQMYKVFHQQQR